MARLLDTSTGKSYVLKPYHVLGRSTQHADCVLSTPCTSLIHACVRWDGHKWALTDQSRNGSFINGRRLTRDRPEPLSVGDGIQYGDLDMAPWKVIDVSPPADLLFPLSLGQKIITLAPFQNLPNDAAPVLCIYRSACGHWCKEDKNGVTPIGSGDVVYIGDHAWRLACAEERPGTAVPSSVVTCMKFQTSQDEEHVSLAMERGRSSLDLGERSHHYLLMLLARQIVADGQRAFDAHARGWVDFDDLVKMLGMDKAHLNIQIFRLRKQFEELVSQGWVQHDFIERRRGGVRLAHVAIEIWKGSRLEGAWHHEAGEMAA